MDTFKNKLAKNLIIYAKNKILMLNKKIFFISNNIEPSYSILKYRFMNISLKDLYNLDIYREKNYDKCMNVLKSIFYHELGHFEYNKLFSYKYYLLYKKIFKLVSYIILIKCLYDLIKEIYHIHVNFINLDNNLENNLVYNGGKINLIIIINMWISYKFLGCIYNMFSEIYSDIYSINKYNKNGLLILFSNKKTPSFYDIIKHKLTKTHPLDYSRYQYIKNNNIYDITKFNRFEILIILFKIYLTF